MDDYDWIVLKEKLDRFLLNVVRVILVVLALILFFPLGFYLIWKFFIDKPVEKAPDMSMHYPIKETREELEAQYAKDREKHDAFMREHNFRAAKDLFNYGECTVVERERAKELLRDAIAKGNSEAKKYLNKIEAAEETVAIMIKRGLSGSAEDAYQVGLLYMKGGEGLSPSMEDALQWFILARNSGSEKAAGKLNLYAAWQKEFKYAMTLVNSSNGSTAWEGKKIVLRLAEAGYPPAIAQQGIMHYNLERSGRGEKEAYYMFARGARLGDPFCIQACIYLARANRTGNPELWIEYANRMGVEVLDFDEFNKRYKVEVK